MQRPWQLQVSSVYLLWFWTPLGQKTSSWWQLHAEGCSQCHSKQSLVGLLWDTQAQCTEEEFHPSFLLEVQTSHLSQGPLSSLPLLPPFQDPKTKLILDHKVKTLIMQITQGLRMKELKLKVNHTFAPMVKISVTVVQMLF